MAIALAIPDAVVNVLDLNRQFGVGIVVSKFIPLFRFMAAGMLLSLLVRHAVRKRWLCRVVRPFVSSWLHEAQVDARIQYANYSEALRVHPQLLGLTSRELAQDAKLPWLVAWYILQLPDDVLREAWHPQLAKALLLPERYFKRSCGYGDRLVCARLNWYLESGIVVVGYTKGAIMRMTWRKRRALLNLVELKAKDRLRQPRRWSHE